MSRGTSSGPMTLFGRRNDEILNREKQSVHQSGTKIPPSSSWAPPAAQTAAGIAQPARLVSESRAGGGSAALRVVLPVFALWWREVIRFLRQRSRVTGALAQPVVFWLLLGSGLNASFRPAGAEGTSYVEYFYPGIIVLVLLFTAIFATISTVEDRRAGFLQGVLVAPVPRWTITLGQAAGGTFLAVLQGSLCLLLAPFLGITLSAAAVVATILIMAVVALALTSLGLIIAWRMESTQGFHAIMNTILIPIWLLSGAFFPAAGAPAPLRWVMDLNPLTYGVAALRRCLYLSGPAIPDTVPALRLSVAVSIVFCTVAFYAAVRSTERALR
jgi:ABC-2 type transport system permease protein